MRRLLPLFALALAPLAARGDGEAVTIKMHAPKVGEAFKETKVSSEVVNVTGSAMGQDFKENNSKTTTSTFVDEAVEVAAGARKPSKFKRTYEKAEVVVKSLKNGVTEKDETKKVPVVGKTVLVEKKDKKHAFTVDGQPADADAEPFLTDDVGGKKDDDGFDVVLPKGEVKAGDTWKVDLAKMAKEFEDSMTVDVAKSSGTGKLVKTYTKDGAVWGVMEVTIDLALTKFGSDGQSFPVKPGGMLSIKFVLDGCLDGTAAGGKATMTMKGKVEADIPMAEIAIDLDMKQESTREPVKK